MKLAVVLAALTAPALRADIAATWDGAIAAWSNATHWSTNPVFPNNATPNFYDVTINAGAVTLDQAISINQLSLGGGLLDGAFSLSAAEGLQWTGGAIAGSGTLALAGTSQFSTAGTLALSSRTVEQNGSATFSTGTLIGGFGATLNNNVGATFTARNQAAFFADSNDPAWTFHNAGSFIARATTGAGFTSMDATFNNTGAVSLEVMGGASHTLQFGAGGTHSGTFALAPDTAIVFGGITILQAGADFTGAGTVFAAGDVTVAADLGMPNLNVAFGGFDLGSNVVNASGVAEFGSSAVLSLAIAGTGVGEFGALTIADTALLDGDLAVSLANGFTPGGGDIFAIVTATGGVGGVFANLPNDGDRFDTADGFGSFEIDYEPGSVFLTNFIPTAIPEPNGAVQMLAWIPVLMSVRLRRRLIRSDIFPS